jgi:secondary thiamine-phosphate synthase enzyme
VADLSKYDAHLGQGSMQTTELTLDTRTKTIVDLTAAVQRFVRPLGSGLVSVFAPHATAGLALIETGSGSEDDLQEALARLLPRDSRWKHQHGSPGHGADHVLPAIISPSLVVPVLDGKPALGTWQSIVFVDLNVDNPVRKVRLSFLSG